MGGGVGGGGRVVTGCERGREENMGQAVHTPVLTIIADEQYYQPLHHQVCPTARIKHRSKCRHFRPTLRRKGERQC